VISTSKSFSFFFDGGLWKIMYEILADRHQTYLFPYKLDDFVKEDSPVRFINSYIDNLDLVSLGLVDRKVKENGCPGYGKEMLLKLWVYGYYN
jgi:transposase